MNLIQIGEDDEAIPKITLTPYGFDKLTTSGYLCHAEFVKDE